VRLLGQRVLVTGATGFVGRHTVIALRDAGADVRASSRLGSEPPQFSAPTDLLDDEAVRQLVDSTRPRHVVHLGGAIARPGLSLGDLLLANVVATDRLMAAAADCPDVESVMVVSSSAVYDRMATLPLAESGRVSPSTDYGISKAAQELVVNAWRLRADYQATVVRLFNVMGPGQSPDLALSAFARQVVAAERGGPTDIKVGRLDTRRDYVDVRDVARAITQLLGAPRKHDDYNVASGVGRSAQEGLDLLLKAARIPLEAVTDPTRVRPADVPVQIGDSARLRAETGWEPVVPFEQTVADLLEYWRQESEAR